ncbi:MAG: hypothetical protein ACJA1B_000012 [Polaribacter sp.]|jgi:hypothetical protein
MKNQKAILLFICFLFSIGKAFAQKKWISDNEMQFKINAPVNFTHNQIYDGTDKVLTIMSPDQNVMIRVRAMPATNQFTPVLLQKAFEQNMIKGAKRIVDENGKLNNIPTRSSAYTWSVDGNNAVLGAYYIVQNGFAYIVWSAIPIHLIQQRSAEADEILNTFTLLNQIAVSSSKGIESLLGEKGSISAIINKKSIGKATPPPPPLSKKPVTFSNPKYLSLVSDDACVEHFYPKGYKTTSVEQGQTIWEDGSDIKMVIQTIIKAGRFRSYTSNNVTSISNKGADVILQKYLEIKGEDVFQYFYTYGESYFAYFAIENNNCYYLVGFVGNNQKQQKIVKYANDVMQSVKKVQCSR